jgi:hypothetical protein
MSYDLGFPTPLIRRIASIAVFASLYNLLVWVIDWFRQDEAYFGPALWAVIPQLFCIFLLSNLLARERGNRALITTMFLFPIFWLITLLTSGIELLLPEEPLPWGFTSSLLESLGFPILELSFRSASPDFGLFHSNMGDLNKQADWYFDGGIQASWMLYNGISIFIVTYFLIRLYQERYDLGRYWNKLNHDS